MIQSREISTLKSSEKKAVINQFELFRSKLADITDMDKRRLGLEGGVKVTAQLSGKLAQRTHMCTGFIINTINEQPIRNMQDFTNAVANKKGVMLGGIYPDGRCDRYYLELV